MRRLYTTLLIILMLLISLGSSRELLYASEEDDFLIAQQAYEDEFYEEARDYFQDFLKKYPQSPIRHKARLFLGICHFKTGQLHKAQGEFNALLTDPEAENVKDEAYFWLAQIDLKNKNYEQAISNLKTITSTYAASEYAPLSQYLIADSYFQLKRLNEAIASYEQFIKEAKEPALKEKAYFNIARAYSALAKYEKSNENLRKLLEDYPDSPEAANYYYLQGENYYNQKLYSEAGRSYEKALGAAEREDKLRPHLILALAWVAFEQEAYDDVFKHAENIISLYPDNNLAIEAKYLRGRVYNKTGYHLEAAEVYEGILQEHPHDDYSIADKVHFWLAESYYQQDVLDKAVEHYEAFKDKFARSPLLEDVHYNLGWIYLRTKEYDKSIKEFEQLTEGAGDKVLKIIALCRTADVYLDSEDYQNAIDTYDQILRNFPESYYADYAQYQLGEVFYKMADYEAALAAFDSLLVVYPNSRLADEAQYKIGMIYLKASQFELAIEEFAKIIEKYPQSGLRTKTLFNIGTCYYNAGQYEKAISTYRDIAENHKNTDISCLARYQLAWSYYKMGEESKAIENFSEVASECKGKAVSYEAKSWLGHYYFQAGNFENAKSIFYDIIKENPGSEAAVNSHYWLGSTYKALKNYRLALDEYRLVYTNFPAHHLAVEARLEELDILLLENSVDEVIARGDELVDKYPESPFKMLALEKIAFAYERKGQLDEAISYLDKAKEGSLGDEGARMQYELASLYEKQDKTNEALDAYLKVIYKFPESTYWAAQARLRSARIYEETGQYEKAEKMYEKALAMDGVNKNEITSKLKEIRQLNP